MSNVRFAAVLSSLAVGFVACAKTPQVETAAAPASNVSVGSDNIGSWAGNISAVTESNSDVRQSGRGNGYGNAQMTPGDSRASTRVNVTYSSGGTNDRNLNWAILPGRCGAGALPAASQGKALARASASVASSLWPRPARVSRIS